MCIAMQALGLTEDEQAACEAEPLQAADLHEQVHAWALQAVPERACKECAAVDAMCQGQCLVQCNSQCCGNKSWKQIEL